MSIAELATELILEIVSHIGRDRCATLLHFALVNKHLFTIVMPTVISTQSARIHALTALCCANPSIELEEAEVWRWEEGPMASYTSYWLHEDCRGNVFARAYDTIALINYESTPAGIYAYMYALISRVPFIGTIILDWWGSYWTGGEPSHNIWMWKLLELCAHKVPPPEIYVWDKPRGTLPLPLETSAFLELKTVRDNADPGPHFKKRKLPLRVLNSITQKFTGMAPFPPIQLPQDNRPMPRQPPRVSTIPYYGCGYRMPTLDLPVAPSPTLQDMNISSQSMFMTSIYPYTVNLLNLAPLTKLQMNYITMSPEAWSQVLYALKIPTLNDLDLMNLSIFFLDIMFFLQRHQAITSLALTIRLLPLDCPEETKFPTHFDLPSLKNLQVTPQYAALFFDGEQRLLNLQKAGMYTAPSRNSISAFCSTYHHMATTHISPKIELALRFMPLEHTGFVEWALTSGTPMMGVRLITTRIASNHLGKKTIQLLTAWWEQNIEAHRWLDPNVSPLQLMVGNLIFAVCPNAKSWEEEGQLHTR